MFNRFIRTGGLLSAMNVFKKGPWIIETNSDGIYFLSVPVLLCCHIRLTLTDWSQTLSAHYQHFVMCCQPVLCTALPFLQFFFPPPVFKRLYLEHVFLLTLLDWGLQRSKAAWTHTEVPEVLVRRHQSFLSGKFDALLHVPRRFEVDLSDNQTPEFCFSLFWFQKLLLFFSSISSFT